MRRGRLGVEIREVSKEVAEAMGIKSQGALVTRVEAGTPADKAGVMGGDIIVKFDGKTIEKSVDLPRAVGDTKPGTKSTLTVLRKGVSKDIPITVAELDADTEARTTRRPSRPSPLRRTASACLVGDLPEDRQEAAGHSRRRARWKASKVRHRRRVSGATTSC